MAATFRRGSWIITLPLAAMAAAYVFFIFLPGRKALAELREEIRVKQDYVDQAGSLPATLAQHKRELNDSRAYAEAWHHRLAEEKELPALFGRIHNAAKAAGIRVTKFDPQAAVAFETLRRVPLSLGCSGSFPQIHKFLRALEDEPAAIWVESLRIDKATEDGRDATGEATLVIFANNPEISGYARQSD
jgi:Tfp pilus assembly protein PilO